MYHLHKKDIAKASKIIAKAFFNDPKICYYLPDKGTRIEISNVLWEFLLKDGINHGKVIAPSSNLEGISIWLPPGKEYISFWRAIGQGILKVVKKFGKLTIKVMNRITKFEEKIHKKHMGMAHWYLSLLAIEPTLQGKGFVSKMMYPMIENINNEKYPIYLETNNPKNVPLYEHYKFRVIENIIIPKTSIAHWSMVRY